MGHQVFFVANVAVMITIGCDPFWIPLGLHIETIKGLPAKVLTIQPVGLLLAAGGDRLPGPLPR